MKIQLWLICYCALFLQRNSYGQAGMLDHTFSNDGLVYQALVEGTSAQTLNVLVQPDGKLLVTGSSDVQGDYDVALLSRFLPNGEDDYDFNGNGNVSLTGPGINYYGATSVLQPDGKIMTLLGENEEHETIITLFRSNEDGSPDLTYGTQGKVIVELPLAEKAPVDMVRQPDGRLIICGYAKEHANDPFQNFFIARCLPDGSLDLDFNEDGYFIISFGPGNARALSVLVQPDGKIATTGFGTFSNHENIVVMRFNMDGTPDLSFHDDGLATIPTPNSNARAYKILRHEDGKLVVGGFVTAVGSYSDFVAARFTPAGYPDPEFNEDGIVIVALSPYADQARSMVLQQDGKVVLGGFAHSNGPDGNNAVLVRLTSAGYLDPTFGENGYFETDQIQQENFLLGMEIQPDGKILGVGKIWVGDYSKGILARFLSGLSVDITEASPPSVFISVNPSPVNEQVSIEYELPEEQHLSISLMDLQGRIVEVLLQSAIRASGRQRETFWINTGLPGGTYIVHLATENGMHTQKLALVR